MKEKKIYLDISQFISHPYKTGIQRVLYEVLNTWKNKEQLVPIFINEKSETNILPSLSKSGLHVSIGSIFESMAVPEYPFFVS